MRKFINRAIGQWRLKYGFCPLCNSSPPRDNCPVCQGSLIYGLGAMSSGLLDDWYDRFERYLEGI